MDSATDGCIALHWMFNSSRKKLTKTGDIHLNKIKRRRSIRQNYLFTRTVAVYTSHVYARTPFFHFSITTSTIRQHRFVLMEITDRGNFRDQWSSIMAVPYKTMIAFGDVQKMKITTKPAGRCGVD